MQRKSFITGMLLFAAAMIFVTSCKKDEDDNNSPVASFTVAQNWGLINSDFNFDASACSDVEDAASQLQVRWDFNNDGAWDSDWTTMKLATVQYTYGDTIEVTLQVKDTEGLTGETSLTIMVWDDYGSAEPCAEVPFFEYEGQVYRTVKIGDQCWMKENLNAGTYTESINTGSSHSDVSDNSIIEKYCMDNNTNNCDKYGALYDWNEVMNYTTDEGAQGICPQGWHIPTDDDWKILEGNCDDQYPVGDPEWDGTDYRGFNAGQKMKTETEWANNGNGTNAVGFGAKPAGARPVDGSFKELTELAYFHTSTTNGNNRWYRAITHENNKSYRNASSFSTGYSVRCIKD